MRNQIFRELDVPQRFSRIEKYFNGLTIKDLKHRIDFVGYAEPVDKPLMYVLLASIILPYIYEGDADDPVFG